MKMQVRSPGGQPFFKTQPDAPKYGSQANRISGPMYGAGYNHAFVQYLQEQHVRPHQVTQRSALLHQEHHQQHRLGTDEKFGKQQLQQVGQQQSWLFQQNRSMLTFQQQQQLHEQIQQARQLVRQHNLFARSARDDLARRQSTGGSGNYLMSPPFEDQGHRPVNHAVAGQRGEAGHTSHVSHVSHTSHVSHMSHISHTSLQCHVSGPTPPPTPSPSFQQTPHKECSNHIPPLPATNNRLDGFLSPPLSSPATPPRASPDESGLRYSDATNCGRRKLPCPPSPPSNQLVKLDQVSLPNAGQSAKERRAELKRLGLPFHSDNEEEEEAEELRLSRWVKRRSTEGNSVARMDVPLLDEHGSVAQISFKSGFHSVSNSIASQ